MELGRINEDLAALMRRKLGIGGRDLADGQRRAGRLLPRRIRRDLTFLSEQALMDSHPRLHAFTDAAAFRRAAGRVRAYLDGIDPTERRKDRILGIAAAVAFNVLLIAGLVIAVLAWRGVIGPR